MRRPRGSWLCCGNQGDESHRRKKYRKRVPGRVRDAEVPSPVRGAAATTRERVGSRPGRVRDAEVPSPVRGAAATASQNVRRRTSRRDPLSGRAATRFQTARRCGAIAQLFGLEPTAAALDPATPPPRDHETASAIAARTLDACRRDPLKAAEVRRAHAAGASERLAAEAAAQESAAAGDEFADCCEFDFRPADDVAAEEDEEDDNW